VGGTQLTDPNQPANKLTRDPVSNHDMFDVLNVDRWEPVTPPPTWRWSWQGKLEFGYNLFPLIVSGGTDFDPNTNTGMGLVFAVPTNPAVASDPFDISNVASPYWVADQDGNRLGSIVHPSANNNIHNQMSGSRP
jgi:hypothetical protein